MVTARTPTDPDPRLRGAPNRRICWYIQVFRDGHALSRCGARLRRHYPESRVVVVSDGDADPQLPERCRALGFELVLGEALFGVQHGGRVSHRMVELFLAGADEILIKIDPDSDVRGRFTSLPDPAYAVLCGTVQSQGEPENRIVSVQGGCMILTRALCEALRDSEILLSDALRPPTLAWTTTALLRERAIKLGLTSHDWTIGWACREHRHAVAHHPEVRSRWLGYYASLPWLSRCRAIVRDVWWSRGAAVSHPRLEWRLLAVVVAPRRRSPRPGPT